MIDREKVIDYLQAALRMKNEYGFCILPFETVEDSIELLKAQTGHWVHEPDRVNHWHCSVCGRTEGLVHRAMAYCPGCGAKMEGEQYGSD